MLTPTPRCRMGRLRGRLRGRRRGRPRLRAIVRARHLQDGKHGGEPIDLPLADDGLALEHIPAHARSARRGGERAEVVVEASRQ